MDEWLNKWGLHSGTWEAESTAAITESDYKAPEIQFAMIHVTCLLLLWTEPPWSKYHVLKDALNSQGTLLTPESCKYKGNFC